MGSLSPVLKNIFNLFHFITERKYKNVLLQYSRVSKSHMT